MGEENELGVAVGPMPAEVEGNDGGEGKDGDPHEERRVEHHSQRTEAVHTSTLSLTLSLSLSLSLCLRLWRGAEVLLIDVKDRDGVGLNCGPASQRWIPDVKSYTVVNFGIAFEARRRVQTPESDLSRTRLKRSIGCWGVKF